MHFDLGFGKNRFEEAIKLLNTSARSFYNGEHTYRDKEYPIILKAAIQTGFVDLERVLRGTFGSGLHMDNADQATLEAMFPNACKRMFNLGGPNGIRGLGFLLDDLRNINSHAILSDKDRKLFDRSFAFLREERVFNKNICYFTDEITLAGVIYILLNFLRAQSIKTLIKKDYVFALISCGFYKYDEGELFVANISHVDLEIGIRKTKGEDLPGAIFGEYAGIMERNGGEFQVKIGDELHPTYDMKGFLEGKTITIKQGSLSKTFYEKDYTLTVEEKDGFIELSNQLPPFVLIDYLYEQGITVFNVTAYNQALNQWQLISKLNLPKFYVDKNLKILLMPNTISDFRLMSGIVSDGLQKIFLLIEDYIYAQKNIEMQSGFSSILEAIKGVDADKELSLNVALLRNMVSHGYILDECFIFKKRTTEYSISFIIRVLKDMLALFKKQDVAMYEFFGNAINKHLTDTIVVGKYRQASKFCLSLMETYPEYDRKEYEIKAAFVEHSMMDVTRFNCLLIDSYKTQRVIRLSIESIPKTQYLLESNEARIAIEDFCVMNQFEVYYKEDNGIVSDYRLKFNDRIRRGE